MFLKLTDRAKILNTDTKNAKTDTEPNYEKMNLSHIHEI